MLHLPFKSLFIALFLVLFPTFIAKLSAEPRASHYYGDPDRRPLDGTPRGTPSWRDFSATGGYDADARDREAVRYAPTSGLFYDGARMPAPIWSGLNIGVHGGGGWGSIETSLGDLDFSGAVLGAHMGYLVRSGALVAGVEFDANLSLMNHTTQFGDAALVADVDWLVSARARAGVVAGPALFYATGGIALAGLSARAGAAGLYAATSGTESGFVLGGGVEIGLNERMAMRIEALHYFMPEERVALPAGLGTMRVDGDVTTVRAGLTFFLN